MKLIVVTEANTEDDGSSEGDDRSYPVAHAVGAYLDYETAYKVCNDGDCRNLSHIEVETYSGEWVARKERLPSESTHQATVLFENDGPFGGICFLQGRFYGGPNHEVNITDKVLYWYEDYRMAPRPSKK